MQVISLSQLHTVIQCVTPPLYREKKSSKLADDIMNIKCSYCIDSFTLEEEACTTDKNYKKQTIKTVFTSHIIDLRL